MVECPLMVQWVIGSIPYGEPNELFLFQPVLHNWCNKGNGMYYPFSWMVHVKDLLLKSER